MTSSPRSWSPRPGSMAIYKGRTKAQTRYVRVLAEAIGGYLVVEAIGQQGKPVRVTVKRSSLLEPEPSLFE